MPPFGVVTVKAGAGFPALAPAGVRILAVLDMYANVSGQSLTVTSGSELRGREASDPHMTGEAVDVSVSNLTSAQVLFLHDFLLSHLGSLFTVLYEVPRNSYAPAVLARIAVQSVNATAPHLHIQRKRGTTWP